MPQSNWVYLEDCTILSVTDKAIKVECEAFSGYLPKSQIENEGDHLAVGDEGVTVAITQWIAETKNIEVD